ncbi:EAL domain-containing protein [Propionivibrio soli]|uniref:EAL domain-containing protein n=1 Tax=Propionivibrio soli TaxID=2976531 RepID=UPI00308410B1
MPAENDIGATGSSQGEAFLRDLLDAPEHILYRLDLVRGGFDYISPIAATTFGVSEEDLRDHGLALLLEKHFHPDDVAPFRQRVRELCRRTPGQTVRVALDHRLFDRYGEIVWYRNSMTVVSGPDGRPTLASGVVVDVSARRKSELALRESERKYRATMDALQVGVFMIQDGKFCFVNPKLCEMFGYSEAELLSGMEPADTVAPELRAITAEKIRRRAAGEREGPYESTGVRKDGTRFPIMILGEPSELDGQPGSVGTVIDMSVQRSVEQALKDATERYSVLFEGAHEAIIVVDVESDLLIDANVGAELLFRHPHEEMVGRRLSGLFPPERSEAFRRALLERALHGHGAPLEMEVLTAEGSLIAVEAGANAMETSKGQHLVQCVFHDIQQRKQAEQEQKLAALVFETSQESILVTDARGNIISVNGVCQEMNGYSAAELIGQTPRILRSGRHSPEFYAAMWETINATGHWQGEVWNQRRNGEVFPVWLRISVYRDASGKVRNYVGTATDISERLAAQERIRQLAYFDPLTNLPNRRMLQDRAQQALASAEREHKQLALLFLDLDHFKTINDSLGHSAGDRLLREVARRLSASVRRMDTVARLGGDEFVVLLTEATLEGTAEVARKILDVVARPYPVDQHELGVTPSVGISVFPQDGTDFETLLKHADAAMYRAKESGRNAYQFFTSEMNAAALERLTLENSLRQGIERGEFLLYYQPQVEVSSGRIVGAEALVRWRHPMIGMVPPGKFIPVAEVSGLIVVIGDWVLREACRQNKAWQDEGLPPIRIAVNISSVQFRGGQLEKSVRTVLADTALAAEWLELELTEGIVMGGANETIDTLQRLSSIGVKLAIDDFGTGYSSLSYLKRFPIDKLKIDQSFVRDIVGDPDDWAIATAVISMGHSLRLSVIAEGVEHAEQLEMLESQGCDEVQGYYFSAPLPAEGFAELLRQQRFLNED